MVADGVRVPPKPPLPREAVFSQAHVAERDDSKTKELADRLTWQLSDLG